MITYTIRTTGSSIKELTKTVKTTTKAIQKGMQELGNKTAVEMRRNVKAGIKRKASGALSSNINLDLIPGLDTIIAGIGKISDLNSSTPYWFVVNYGARFPGNISAALEGKTGLPYVPPVTRGYFNGNPRYPDGSLSDKKRKQVWTTRSNGKFYMVPKKPIRPSNYIEETRSWLTNYWDIFWASI